MKSTHIATDRLADSMIYIGIGVAIFFWIFKSVLLLLATGEVNLRAQFIGTDIYDFYDRLAVITLFIFFGSHAQYNIKKRQSAEIALLGSEDKYRSILESIEEGYYEIDLGYRITFFNDSFQLIFGSPRHELLNMDMLRLVSKESSEQLSNGLSEVFRTGRPSKNIEVEFSGRGGIQRIVELSASLIIDVSQKPKGFRGIVRDVTEKRLLERKVCESLKDVKEARTGAILGLAKLAEYRDNDTGQHLERIREYTKILAQELSKNPTYSERITPEYIDDLYHSSILHDIGKVGVSDSILLKPGKLTQEEFEIMKTHVILGGNALAAVDSHIRGRSFLTIGKEIAYYHHERWDGTGYPNGLKRDEIPLSARLVTLADVYDAITSKRCYKEAFTHEQAKDIILNERGKTFDPELVDAFLSKEEDFKRIRAELHN